MIPFHTRIISILLSTNITRLKSSSIDISSSATTNIQPPSSFRPPEKIVTTFILSDTKHPGNVGSAARAMKTMGFDKLYLVRPHDERVLTRKKCIDGASGAVDILQNAKVFDSLEEIFNQDNKRSSCSCSSSSTGEGKSKLIVCGTGMPLDMSRERPMQKYVAPRKYFKELLSTTTVSAPDHDCCESLNIAFVFGNERTGMTFSDMDMCDVMLGIPTNPSFGSLNLASAVQIIAYDWREAMGGFPLIDDNFKS